MRRLQFCGGRRNRNRRGAARSLPVPGNASMSPTVPPEVASVPGLGESLSAASRFVDGSPGRRRNRVPASRVLVVIQSRSRWKHGVLWSQIRGRTGSSFSPSARCQICRQRDGDPTQIEMATVKAYAQNAADYLERLLVDSSLECEAGKLHNRLYASLEDTVALNPSIA
jgi:hypothetical protein